MRDWQVQAALARSGVRLAPRPQRLAAQRRRYTEERIAARVAALGFADVHAYLVDRVVERAWLLADVAVELAAHRVTVRRLLARHGIRRVRRTPGERAAADSGRRVQSVGWQARRAARLAELGFADLAGYLKARRVSRAGRSGGCGPSFGLAAGGWWGSWPGWACDPDPQVRPWRHGCWASGGPQTCCGGLAWCCPGFAGSGGGRTEWALGVPQAGHSSAGDGSCKPQARQHRCGLWIPVVIPGCGAVEWRVIDG